MQRTVTGPGIIMASKIENSDLIEIKTCIQEDTNWYVKVMKLLVFKSINTFFHITLHCFHIKLTFKKSMNNSKQ